MSLAWQARSGSLAWSNHVYWWWGLLTLVSGINISVGFVLYRELPLKPTVAAGSATSIGGMLLFCAAYVLVACRKRHANESCSTRTEPGTSTTTSPPTTWSRGTRSPT